MWGKKIVGIRGNVWRIVKEGMVCNGVTKLRKIARPKKKLRRFCLEVILKKGVEW